MLNEFAYCPRLAYLEWVQGEFVHSLDTLEGRFGHRRVDEPTRGALPVPVGASADSAGKNGATAARGAASDGTAGDGVGSDVAANGANPDGDEVPIENRTFGADPIHARSLMLSAPGEGLICKVDVLEIDGDVATPVDYKRGKAPDVIEGAWEPERVQVCAQGLILREAGYRSDEGVLYFIESKKRVPVIFDEDLVARTRELIAGLRRMGKEQVMPAPLVDSPKCPRCSLVGICLPDETNLLHDIERIEDEEDVDSSEPDPGEFDPGEPGGVSPRMRPSNLDPSLDPDFNVEFEAHGIVDNPARPPLPPLAKGGNGASTAAPIPAAQNGAASVNRVRRLMPARDDALPLYVQEQGASVGKSGDRLTVKEKGKLVHDVRLIDVSQVSIFGNVQVTAQALRELSSRGVPVCHFSYGGWLNAITTGLIHKNVELRIRQFAVAADASESLVLARQFVVGKIKNSRTLLRRHLPEERGPVLGQLIELAEQAGRASCAATLLGIEGMAAKLYFAGFARLLKGGEEFDIEGRNRRPPKDPTNALLSFVYSMLARELTVVLQAVGFDPLLGVFHRPRYGRPSLALDLAEEFRPLIADSTVLTLINNGEVSAESFICRGGAVALTTAGRRAVIEAFERRLESEVTHPLFGYRVSYRRILEVQARLLSRVLLGDLAEYPNFCTR